MAVLMHDSYPGPASFRVELSRLAGVHLVPEWPRLMTREVVIARRYLPCRILEP